MLDGIFAEEGYDWWWHSFTGISEKTGEEKAFFIEFFTCNPELGEDKPVLGQLPENKKFGIRPSYLMIKAGCWGEDACQIHRFFGWDKVDIRKKAPFCIEADDCYLSETELRGSVSVFDEEAEALLAKGVNPISFPGLTLAITSDESKEINFVREPKVIISASGMCEAGRIKHHLKHNLWQKNATILFVGYQAVGTLGRSIVEGNKTVKLFGESIQVAAEICQLPGISGHADRDGLIRWAGGLERPPVKTFVVHGEDEVTDSFAETLRSELGFDADAPFSGTVYDLLAGEYVKRTEGVPYVKRDADGNPVKINTANATKAYQRLTNVAERLMSIVRRSSGVSNKDLARLADQLTSICDKWEQ